MAPSHRPGAGATALNGASVAVVIPCFRDAKRASSLAIAMRSQTLPPGAILDIVVVDDGSGEEAVSLLRTRSNSDFRLVTLPTNQGRSAARNAGARECNGDVIVFLDADCIPTDEGFLAAHLSAHRAGALASTGHVRGHGDGFWNYYQTAASLRRRTQHASGNPWAGSSQNMAIQREAFWRVGGFDTGYSHYGFEDRDLLIRLSRLGRIDWVEEATVIHLDTLTLKGVTRKMIEAGRYSSSRFAKDHRLEYRQLGYGRIDLRAFRLPAFVRSMTGTLLATTAVLADRLIETKGLPMWLKVATVSSLSAAAFAYGTMLSAAEGRSQ